jgi:type IV pilus assembly protein PilA
MSALLSTRALVASIVVLAALALWRPVRLASCLFSARTREAVRKRWLLHIGWGLLNVTFVSFILLSNSAREDYTACAQMGEGYAVANGEKTGIGERWRETQTFPHSNEEAGIAPPEELGGTYLESLTVTVNGSVMLRYVDSAKLPKGVRGRTIVFVPMPERDGLKWDCTRGDVPGRLRPRKCRTVE